MKVEKETIFGHWSMKTRVVYEGQVSWFSSWLFKNDLKGFLLYDDCMMAS